VAPLANVKLLALDVDGTLTDGGVYYADTGVELKRFHIQDGLGIVLAGLVGLRIAWITGRVSVVVERRARELGVADLQQGVRDKAAAVEELAARHGLPLGEVAYMGDDLNDLPALRVVGVPLAPANAVEEVRRAARIVTDRPGGGGAAREAIELLLRARGDYDTALGLYLDETGSAGNAPADPTPGNAR
jgi:3-deoxy-D-manno-octulosonate 8-phosphate phosphatase (KDO 8-P phosphatase)